MNEIKDYHLIGFIYVIARRMRLHRDELNQLDSLLGDGDHGTNMTTVFEVSERAIDSVDRPTLLTVWQTVATVSQNRIEGDAGKVLSTFFAGGIPYISDKAQLSKADMDVIFQAGLINTMEVTSAKVGDKTLMDALVPAVNAFTKAGILREAWKQTALAARQGAESTCDMVAKYGQAQLLGDQSIGLQDAGATTIALMFEAIHEYWESRHAN